MLFAQTVPPTNYLQYKLCAGFSFPGLFFCNVVEYMDGYIELDYFGYVITMQISKPSLRNGTPSEPRRMPDPATC